jgi:hypothetical protein
MKKLLSFLLICTMMLASVLAIIPASAADTETVGFLPEGLYAKLAELYEADGASTNDYVPGVTPFAYTNYSINERIAGSKLLSISIPVRKTLAADAEGNFTFTLSTIKSAEVAVNATPTATYVIKIKGADYGLEANKSNIFKSIKVDVSSYNINVAEDEVLAFAGAADTLLPAWTPNDNSSVQKKIKEEYDSLVGFAANVGKSNYSANANSCIFFDLELEKAKGWDEEEPETTEKIDFTYYDTKRYMPEDVYAELKALFEKDGANTSDWVPSVAPFTPVNAAFQNLMAGTRMRSITLPIKKTLSADADGNFKFTISTFKRDGLTNSAPVNTYTIKINAEKYGLTPNTSGIFKFIKFDVSEYNIVVAKDEVLAFSANGDTIIPGYSGNVASFLKSKFPMMMGFGAYTGNPKFTSNTWTSGCIFFDMEYDVPVNKGYAELRDIIAEVKDYVKDDYSAGWDTFKLTLDTAIPYLEEKRDSSDDLSAMAKALKEAVDALVPLATVDFAALNTAITAAKAFEGKGDEYTPLTWDAFAKALADAKAVAADAKSKQSAVNAATKALTDAQAALAKKPDLDTLAAEITKCESLSADTYITSTWEALADALSAAKAVKDNVNSTADDVTAAINALKAAYDALDKKGETTALQAKIDEVSATYARELYTANSYKILNDLIYAAGNDIEAGEIGEKSGAEYIKKIDEAIAGLKKKADIDALKALVEKWESVTDKDYHPDGVAELIAIVDEIREACKPAKAANLSVEEADEFIESINNAVAGLKKYADYTEIDAKLAEAENLVKTDYTAESWQKLVEAKTAINTLKSNKLATEEDAIVALANLNKAIEGLTKPSAEQPTEDANATEDKPADDTTDTKSGCGSFVGASALVVTVVSVLGCAVVLKKKD